jgi:hypothetical protein
MTRSRSTITTKNAVRYLHTVHRWWTRAARIRAVALGLSLPVYAWAQPEPDLRVHWDAPAACPDAEAVRAQARARLRGGAGRPVTASGTIVASPAGDGFVLDLVVEGTTGVEQRQLRDASCEALAEAAGLLIAVAADPTLAQAPASPADEPPPSEPPLEVPPTPDPGPTTPPPPAAASPSTTPTTPAADRTPTDATPSPPTKLRAVVRAEVLGQFLRLLPNAAGVGVGGALGLLLPRARVELRGRYFLPQRTRYDERPAIGGDFELWTLGVVGCAEPHRGRVAFPLCGGLELGGVRGQSFGVPASSPATSLVADLTADAAVVIALRPRLGLWLGAQGVVALLRPRFHVRGLDTLYRVGPAALRLVAGVEVRFP